MTTAKPVKSTKFIDYKGSRWAILPLASLFVDYTYQREPSASFLKDKYDENETGTLVVAARPKNRYAIIDGSHRFHRMLDAGETHAMCEIRYTSPVPINKEATTFVVRASQRTMKPYHKFRAMVAKRDSMALHIIQVVEEHDWYIPYEKGVKKNGRKSIRGTGKLMEVYGLYGP